MSTATKTRRGRRKPATAKIGKEAWQVIDPEGHVIAIRDGKTHSETAMLPMTQRLAERWGKEISLIVQLVPLFGDPAPYYRVERDADGVVHTTPI